VPRDRPDPGSPHDWMRRAMADLALANVPLPAGGLYEDLCFHAQQAAEKALKAVYVRFGWPFRYVHDLEELVTGLRGHGLSLPEDIESVLVLTTYASDARYPGLPESVTEDEYDHALAVATSVVRWAESIVDVSPPGS